MKNLHYLIYTCVIFLFVQHPLDTSLVFNFQQKYKKCQVYLHKQTFFPSSSYWPSSSISFVSSLFVSLTFFHFSLFHFLGFLCPCTSSIFPSCSCWSNASTSSVSPQLISCYLFTSISFTFLYFFYFSKENKAQKDSPKAELEYKLEGFVKMFWECESRTRGQNNSKINLIVCRANPPKRIWLYPCTSKHSAPVVPVVWVYVPHLFPLFVSLPFSCQSLSFPQTPIPLFFLLSLCWSEPFFFRWDSLALFYF